MAGKKKGFNLAELLNEKTRMAAVRETGHVQGEQEAFTVTMLDVEDLVPSQDNFYQTEKIDELAQAIELAGGIEQNLVVKPAADGRYEVLAGHRRRLAVLKLLGEGKEGYRHVPCVVHSGSDAIKDKLILILTNSTARELSDWEKVQQAITLKKLLEEYKEALAEENKDRPRQEQTRMGRVREVVAQMLHTSTTQVGRMEAIENNLSQAWKKELEKGGIGISAAHGLSRLGQAEQEQAYKRYQEIGVLKIKDVQEAIAQQSGQQKGKEVKVQQSGQQEAAIPGQMEIEDYPQYLPENWRKAGCENQVREMMGPKRADESTDPESTEKGLDVLGENTEQGEGAERLLGAKEKALDFADWVSERYGMSQDDVIRSQVRTLILLRFRKDKDPQEWENDLTDALSEWIWTETMGYKQYLLGRAERT